MSVRFHSSPDTPAHAMNAEIFRLVEVLRTGDAEVAINLGAVPDTDEPQQTDFLIRLCRALQNTAVKYCDDSPDATTRTQRLAEIHQTFQELQALVDQQDFTTASKSAKFERASRTDNAELPADLNDDKERQTRFIKTLARAFQTRAEQYYRERPDAATRLQRLAEISQTFRELHFVTAQGVSFTTAADNANVPAEVVLKTGGEGCPEGTSCIDRNCIPNGDGDGSRDGGDD